MVHLCDYGCGQEATYQFKNGKWCCSKKWMQCKAQRNRVKQQTTGINNPNYGKQYSKEYRKKLSNSHKGKQLSNAHKRKISKSNKGHIVSEETKRKISNANKGKQHSDEFKELMSKIKTNHKHSEETKRKISISNKGKKQTEKTKIKIGNANRGKKHSVKFKRKLSILKTGLKHSSEHKNKRKITVSKIKKGYPVFSKIEEMRYNPNKQIEEREIQVHCKNHNCSNSKEQGGWFTPTRMQLSDRISCLERFGVDHSNFYCSIKCKEECPLYRTRSDPYKDNKIQYTQEEYQTFRTYVLERDEYKCQYCGEKAEHVHHERPQKIEPFFALDPDLAWSVCKKCHYKYGHKKGSECSLGNLANKNC